MTRQITALEETISTLTSQIADLEAELKEAQENQTNLKEYINTLEGKMENMENSMTEAEANKEYVLFQDTLNFEGNKTIVVSLKENEMITFSLLVKEGAINFTFGFLGEEKFDNINYVTNLVPEFQMVFSNENLLTQISFEYVTSLEGLYGFSIESNGLVILDVYLSKK
jgi:uncharacterized coiled-coil protein SlyX